MTVKIDYKEGEIVEWRDSEAEAWRAARVVTISHSMTQTEMTTTIDVRLLSNSGKELPDFRQVAGDKIATLLRKLTSEDCDRLFDKWKGYADTAAN